MVRIMSNVLPCETAEQYDLLYPILIKILNDEDDDIDLRLESLSIFRTLLKTGSEMEKFQNNAEGLLEQIIKANDSKLNKITTEGLKLSAVFSHIISNDPDEENANSFEPMVPLITKL